MKIMLKPRNEICVGSILLDIEHQNHILVVQEDVFFRFVNLDSCTLYIGGERMGTLREVSERADKLGYKLVGNLNDCSIIEE